MTSIVDYIQKLVEIPSPTGFTKDVGAFLVENAAKKNIDVVQTRKGAVIYRFDCEKSDETVLFAAHVDTLGAMVTKIKEDSVMFSPVGGSPPSYLVGNYCTIHGFEGEKNYGTILPDNPAFHVNDTLKKKYRPDLSNLSIRVDIPKEENDKNYLKKEIEIGNFISFDPGFSFAKGFVKSRHLDDKASCAILLYLADLIVKEKIKLRKNVQFFFNISEETGQGIAGFSDMIDDLIIVDMGVVGEGCNGDEYHVSICAKDTSGPYNYDLTQELIKICKKENIGYKIDVFPFYGSDGSSVMRSCKDMRVALIGPGVSASHGYERTHVNALDRSMELIRDYISK